MTRFLSALLIASGLYAQTNLNVLTIIPSTNSSGVPSAAGELRFRDLTNPASATPKYWGFKAPSSLTANHVYEGPNGGTGCWQSDSMDVITLATCPTLPFSDVSAWMKNSSDATKLMKFDLGAFTTGTTRTVSFQDFDQILAARNHAQTFSGIQSFSNNILPSGTVSVGTDAVPWDAMRAAQFRIVDPSSAAVYAIKSSPVSSDTHLIIADPGAATILEYQTTGGLLPTYKLHGTILPDANTSYTIGNGSFNYSNVYTEGVANTFGTNLVLENDRSGGGISLEGWDTSFGGVLRRMLITSTGVVQIANLAGTGNRLVCSDSSGNLSAPGSCSAGSSPPFSDGSALIKNASDATKLIAVSAAAISTGTTRTVTAQNANYTLAGTNLAQTFSGDQTFSNNILPSGTTQSIGLDSNPFQAMRSNQFRIVDPSSAAVYALKSSLVSSDTHFKIEDPGATTIFEYLTTSGILPTFKLHGAILPDANTSYTIGNGSFNYSNVYTEGVTNSFNTNLVLENDHSGGGISFEGFDSGFGGILRRMLITSTGVIEIANLSGSGTRCIQVNNSGDLAVASAGCASGTVTSIATTGPITGGVITGTGTIACATCVVGASGNQKVASGFAQFSSGSVTVNTGISTVFAACSIYTGGGGTTEGCNLASTSGANVTFSSSTNAGSSFINWVAFGNP